MEKNFKLHNQLAPKKKKGGGGGGDNRDDKSGRENSGFKTKGRDGGERSESFDKPRYKKDRNDGDRRDGGYKKEYKGNNESGGYKKREGSGGGDYKRSEGGERRDGGYKKRESGEYRRSEGGDSGGRDGGYKKEYRGNSEGGGYKRREGSSSGDRRDGGYKKEYRGSNDRGGYKKEYRGENRNAENSPSVSDENAERPYKRERNDRDFKRRDGGGGYGRDNKRFSRGGDRKFSRDRDRDRGNRYDRKEKDSDTYERKSPKESYIIYGKHPVLAAIKNENRKKLKLFVTQNGQEFLRERLGNEIFSQIETQMVMPDKLDRIIGEQDRVTHQGIGLEVKPLYLNQSPATQNYKRICILDDITDPHNVGAIIRTAKAFGFDAVITEEKNSPNENATICKTSAGVIEIMPYIRVQSLHNLIESVKGDFEVIGLDGSSDVKLNSYSTGRNVALVIGAEGKGLSPHIKRLCDTILSIEIEPVVESLNASVAAALALSKFKA